MWMQRNKVITIIPWQRSRKNLSASFGILSGVLVTLPNFIWSSMHIYKLTRAVICHRSSTLSSSWHPTWTTLAKPIDSWNLCFIPQWSKQSLECWIELQNIFHCSVPMKWSPWNGPLETVPMKRSPWNSPGEMKWSPWNGPHEMLPMKWSTW